MNAISVSGKVFKEAEMINGRVVLKLEVQRQCFLAGLFYGPTASERPTLSGPYSCVRELQFVPLEECS